MAKQKTEVVKKKKEKDIIIKIGKKKYKKEQFLIEEFHPAVGRIMIVEDMKFKIMDNKAIGSHRSGTFIAKLTDKDEEMMREYDEDIEELSEKLVDRLDIKRMIKEKLKEKSPTNLKTGLFILKKQDEGEDVEEEHHRGCYNYKIHYKNQTFDFIDGIEMIDARELS